MLNSTAPLRVLWLALTLSACAPAGQSAPNSPDLEPDAFSFVPITGVAPDPVLSIRSQTITLSGFNRPLLLKATSGTTVYINGEYRDYFDDNSKGFEVNSGQTVAVAVSPSNKVNSDTITTLEVGAFKTTFKVTTRSTP
jgi:hypothetical protein